jgi:membrane protein YdbS with pleckstrin-like domain
MASTLPDLTVRPTAKFLKAGAILAGLTFLALEYFCLTSWNAQVGSPLIMIAPVLILLWPAMRALKRRYTRVVIAGDRLRYETGMTHKSTRTIQLTKVQDVRVDQGLTQRMLNIGDISIETAGETSRLTVPNVDNAQALVEEILNRAQHGAAST